jgi:hypothetical protein
LYSDLSLRRGERVRLHGFCATNNDETIDVSDAIMLLGHLFSGTAPLPLPFEDCEPDLTGFENYRGLVDVLLDCQQYNGCGHAQTDTDGDGLTDYYEHKIGTDVNMTDTDGDNFTDGEEVFFRAISVEGTMTGTAGR